MLIMRDRYYHMASEVQYSNMTHCIESLYMPIVTYLNVAPVM